jgi:hypothetical protein
MATAPYFFLHASVPPVLTEPSEGVSAPQQPSLARAASSSRTTESSATSATWP